VDEAEHGADDADRRAVPAAGLEDLGGGFLVLFFLLHRDLHALAKRRRIGAVDGHHEGLREEGIGGLGRDLLEREDAFASGAQCVVDDLFDQLRRIDRWLFEGRRGALEGVQARGELECTMTAPTVPPMTMRLQGRR